MLPPVQEEHQEHGQGGCLTHCVKCQNSHTPGAVESGTASDQPNLPQLQLYRGYFILPSQQL